jgi:hypothetical protein
MVVLSLTPMRFFWLISIYKVFQQDKFYKKGFGSVNSLGVAVQGSYPSESFCVFVQDCLGCGVLFRKEGLIFLDEDLHDEFVKKSIFYDDLKVYLGDKSFLFLE